MGTCGNLLMQIQENTRNANWKFAHLEKHKVNIIEGKKLGVLVSFKAYITS